MSAFIVLSVMFEKEGIQEIFVQMSISDTGLDSRLRGNDGKLSWIRTFVGMANRLLATAR